MSIYTHTQMLVSHACKIKHMNYVQKQIIIHIIHPNNDRFHFCTFSSIFSFGLLVNKATSARFSCEGSVLLTATGSEQLTSISGSAPGATESTICMYGAVWVIEEVIGFC